LYDSRRETGWRRKKGAKSTGMGTSREIKPAVKEEKGRNV
jgi:hypothetical protein